MVEEKNTCDPSKLILHYEKRTHDLETTFNGRMVQKRVRPVMTCTQCTEVKKKDTQGIWNDGWRRN